MVCRARKIALRAPAPAAAAIAVVLVLLTSVDAGAQQPYYPYPCPFISGGRDLDGDQLEGPVSFDPRTGVWSKIFIPPATVTWGQWGDLPTPGDFDGDGVDDVAIWRPSTGTWWVRCSTPSNCPLGIIAVGFGAPGDIPLPADFNNDGFTDYGIWKPDDGAWFVLSGADRFTDLVQGVKWGQYGDCPVPGRLLGSGPGPPRAERLATGQRSLVLRGVAQWDGWREPRLGRVWRYPVFH